MKDEFDHGTLYAIKQMVAASKTLPDDFFMTEAMQELAAFISRNDALLGDEECAILIGIGALLVREGRAEMMAGLQARMALMKAAKP